MSLLSTIKKFSVTGGSAPYTYSFSANAPCVTIEGASGTSVNGNITTTLVFDGTDCIAGTTVTLTITDSDGCISTQDVVVDNPCTGFTVGNIVKGTGYSLTCSAVSPYDNTAQFEWFYDKTIFTRKSGLDSALSSTIELSPIAGKLLPASSLVKCRVSNSAGCTQEKTYSLSICTPVSSNVTATASCPNDAGTVTATVNIPVPTGACANINWATFKLANGFLGFDGWTSINFNYPSKTTDPLVLNLVGNNVTRKTYTVKYTVADVTGVLSTEGIITVQAPSCDNRIAGIILNDPIYKPSTVSPGDTITFRIDDKVTSPSGAPIDWSTFTVLNTPLATPTVAAALDGTVNMEYVVPALNPDDIIIWTVSDSNGVQAYPATTAVVTANAAPVAVPDSVGVVWGQSTVKDVLANDTVTDPLDVTSVKVTQESQLGLTAVQDNGDIEVFGLTWGIDTFKYTVADIYGKVSNEALVGVQVFYAGEDGDTAACVESGPNIVAVTPANYITSPEGVTVNSGGTWTFISGPGVSPAAPGAWNGSITFNNAVHTYGVHTYRYTVTVFGVTHTADVSIDFEEYVAAVNIDCASASVLPFGGIGTTIAHTGFTNSTLCPGQGPVPGSGVANPAEWGAGTYDSDLWFKITAPVGITNYVITVTVNGSAYGQTDGIYAPAIAIYDGTCGALNLVAANATSVSNQSITSSVIMDAVSPKDFFIRVDALDTYEGQFDIEITTI